MKRQVGTKISAKPINSPCYVLGDPLHTAHFYSAAYIPETFVPMLLITKFGGAFMAVAEEQGSAGGKRYLDVNGNKLHEQDIREFAIWSEE